MLTARGDAAGIPNMHSHLLRHAWCHYSLDGGVGDSNVITLAGWTSGRQLARYGRALAVQPGHGGGPSEPGRSGAAEAVTLRRGEGIGRPRPPLPKFPKSFR